MLFLTVLVQSCIFTLYYMNPTLNSASMLRDIVAQKGVDIPSLVTDAAGRGWGQLCHCLDETNTRISHRPPTRRVANPQMSELESQRLAIEKEFDRPRQMSSFASFRPLIYDDVFQRSLQDFTKGWLVQVADGLGMKSMLQFPEAFACLLRLSMRLLVPSLVHTFFSYFR